MVCQEKKFNKKTIKGYGSAANSDKVLLHLLSMPRGHGRRRGRNPHPYRDPPLQDVQQPHPTIKLKRNNLRHELKKYMLKRALILYPFKGILSTTIVTSCYRFSCYYRFSDIAINSVNPSFTQGLGASEKKILYIYIVFFGGFSDAPSPCVHSYDEWNFQRMAN
jgi:hypothetical protein